MRAAFTLRPRGHNIGFLMEFYGRRILVNFFERTRISIEPRAFLSRFTMLMRSQKSALSSRASRRVNALSLDGEEVVDGIQKRKSCIGSVFLRACCANHRATRKTLPRADNCPRHREQCSSAATCTLERVTGRIFRSEFYIQECIQESNL